MGLSSVCKSCLEEFGNGLKYLKLVVCTFRDIGVISYVIADVLRTPYLQIAC